jgi:nicotinamidase-related amidase
MAFRHINDKPISPIFTQPSTCLILVNCQLGSRNIDAWGHSASNPDFERNCQILLDTFRQEQAKKPRGERPLIFHIQYRPVWTDHPLHVSQSGPWGKDGEVRPAIDFMECTVPLIRDSEDGIVKPQPSPGEPFPNDPPPEEEDEDEVENQPKVEEAADKEGDDPEHDPFKDEIFLTRDEFIMSAHGENIFIHSQLMAALNARKIRTLLFAGMPLEQGVSTAIRSAHHHALVGELGLGGNQYDSDTRTLWSDGVSILGKLKPENKKHSVDMMRLVLVEDATKAFSRGRHHADVVHEVHADSLKDFAEVRLLLK